jgi:hypothetical protein
MKCPFCIKAANNFQEWLGSWNQQDKCAHAETSKVIAEHIQNMAQSHVNNLQTNAKLALNTFNENLSANNAEQMITNNYQLLKDVAANTATHSKEVLAQISTVASDLYSSFTDSAKQEESYK